MTHEIDPDRHYIEGETRTWVFVFPEETLTGASAEWYLLPNRGASTSDALLSDGDGASVQFVDEGEAFSTEPDQPDYVDEQGFEVAIEAGETTGLAGELWHRLVVDGPDGSRDIARGPFPIEPL